MKKLVFIFSVACCFFSLNSVAQAARVGFDVGLSISNMTVSGPDAYNKGDARTGFTFGMMADFPGKKKLSKFSFQPGLHYVTKGMISNTPSGTTTTELKVVVNYAELAANILYHVANPKGDFFFGLGPTVGSALPGAKTIKNGAPTELLFGHTESKDMRRWDYGANFMAGYKLSNGAFLSANYTLGLRNLLPEGTKGKLKNTAIGVKLGILFNNEK